MQILAKPTRLVLLIATTRLQPVCLVAQAADFLLNDLSAKRVNIAIEYYNESQTVDAEIKLEVGLGF